MQNSDSHPPIPEPIDVAFSLLAGDAAVAEQLCALLRDRLRVFLWSDHQKDIAAKDGVAVFTELYEKRAQLVVVLYRAGYGTTKWTRVEESAITSRGVNLGWSSVFLISLDGTKPSWLPASRLWFGLKEFGPSAAAEAIEARFSDLGAVRHPETILEKALRIERVKQGEEEAQLWRRSDRGVKQAIAEVEHLWEHLTTRVNEINGAAPSFGVQLRTSPSDRFLRQLYIDGASVSFGWHNQYSNSLSGASLFMREFARRVSKRRFIDNDSPIEESAYLPFLDWKEQRVVWRLRTQRGSDDTTGPSRTTEQLADFFIERMLSRKGGIDVD